MTKNADLNSVPEKRGIVTIKPLHDHLLVRVTRRGFDRFASLVLLAKVQSHEDAKNTAHRLEADENGMTVGELR